jgi:hypothetical protein
MSRRGNCVDNAVAERFQLLKRERIRRKIYRTRSEARSDLFDYIEMFYNPVRRQRNNDGRSPVDYEKDYLLKLGSIWGIRVDSNHTSASATIEMASFAFLVAFTQSGVASINALFPGSDFYPVATFDTAVIQGTTVANAFNLCV